jgi:hypothetical protein
VKHGDSSFIQPWRLWHHQLQESKEKEKGIAGDHQWMKIPTINHHIRSEASETFIISWENDLFSTNRQQKGMRKWLFPEHSAHNPWTVVTILTYCFRKIVNFQFADNKQSNRKIINLQSASSWGHIFDYLLLLGGNLRS